MKGKIINKMDIQKVCTETLAILSFLGADYVNKLPKKVLKYIVDNSNSENIPQIDYGVGLEENETISRDTKVFITTLKINYWCDSNEEKQAIVKKIQENGKNNTSEN